MSEENFPWWESIVLCRGLTKKGKRCRRPCRPPEEVIGKGLVIFHTCTQHKNQEDKVRGGKDVKEL